MEKILYIVYFAVIVAQYYLVYEIWFKDRIKRYWVPAIGAGLYAVFILISIETGSHTLLSFVYVFVILSVFFAQVQKGRIGLTRVLTIMFFVSCFEQMLLMFGELIIEETGSNFPVFLLQMIINILMLSVIVAIRLGAMSRFSNQGRKIVSLFNKHVSVFVIVMSIIMMITIVGLDIARESVSGHGFRVFSAIIIGLANGSVVLLGVCTVYINRTNRKIERLLESEIRLKDLQKCYYESLLKKEEETKSFRHDMVNHLISLEGMVENDEKARSLKYILDIRKGLESQKNSKYDMGNTVLDTLTSYYVNMLDKSVEVKVWGRLKAQPDEMRLCIIYGNLIQNAVEEVMLCKKTPWLHITIEQGEEFFRIVMENSLSGMKQKKRINNSQGNHGIGLENVRKAVEELGGLLEVESVLGYKVSVSLPNVMSN